MKRRTKNRPPPSPTPVTPHELHAAYLQQQLDSAEQSLIGVMMRTASLRRTTRLSAGEIAGLEALAQRIQEHVKTLRQELAELGRNALPNDGESQPGDDGEVRLPDPLVGDA